MPVYVILCNQGFILLVFGYCFQHIKIEENTNIHGIFCIQP
jgi:hypothetical protein